MDNRFTQILLISAAFLSLPVPAEDDITVDTGLTAYRQGNYLESFYIWKTLAEEGDSLAAYHLGVLYTTGLGVKPDDAMALAMYRQSAAAGYAPAQYNLGMAYLLGEGVSIDYEQAAKWWLKAAEQDHIQAIFKLATLYAKGLGVEKNEEIARGYYKMAADLGDARSARVLEGLAVRENARLGQPEIMTNGDKNNDWVFQQPEDYYTVQIFAMRNETLALNFIEDSGLVNDIALFQARIDGEDWYKALYQSFENRKAAIQARDEMRRAFPEQAPWLRKFYDVRREVEGKRTQGVPGQKTNKTSQQIKMQKINSELRRGQSAFINQRYAEAFEVWRPLAEKDVAEAQYGLGFMYESGWGLERDYARAYVWYERAASLGHAKSQYNLGMLYLNGFGVEKNLNKAQHWINAAASGQDPRAIDYVERVQIREK